MEAQEIKSLTEQIQENVASILRTSPLSFAKLALGPTDPILEHMLTTMSAVWGVPKKMLLGGCAPTCEQRWTLKYKATLAPALPYFAIQGVLDHAEGAPEPEPFICKFGRESARAKNLWQLAAESRFARQTEFQYPKGDDGLIYRVESLTRHSPSNHKLGAGAYNSNIEDKPYSGYDPETGEDTHPTLNGDPGFNRYPELYEYFGFENLDKLRAWFFSPECRRSIDDELYGIMVYEGQVQHGKRQSVLDTRFPFRCVGTVRAW